MMKRIMTTVTLAAATMLLAAPAALADGPEDVLEHAIQDRVAGVHQYRSHEPIDQVPVVREFNEEGEAVEDGEIIGWSDLSRGSDGLQANVNVRGLTPGGVYTFWWVVPHVFEDGAPVIPSGVFVAGGAGTVVGADGTANVQMLAYTEQSGIEGFPPLDGAEWGSLTDPLGSIVRVEIAYHGQVEDAERDLGTFFPTGDGGSNLETQLLDFWTGSACPPETANPNPDQPHCPVYFAATHLP